MVSNSIASQMGVSSSIVDNRPQAQKNLEKSMGMQLMIPYSILGPQPSVLAVGTFEGGEFHQTADLNVNNLFHPETQLLPRTANRLLTFYQTTKADKHMAIVNIKENWNVEEVDLFPLNKVVIGKKIDKRMYGFKKDLYIVRAVHTSTNFGVACGDRGIDYIDQTDPTEKIWGYQLVRYKIDSHGFLQHDSKFSKVY